MYSNLETALSCSISREPHPQRCIISIAGGQIHAGRCFYLADLKNQPFHSEKEQSPIGLVNGLPHSTGVLAERYPGQAAIRQMVALRRGLAALAPLQSRQLLKAAVKFLHLPAHRRGLNRQFAGQMSGQVIGNEPFNVAVLGHQLEGFYAKGPSFRRTSTRWLQPWGGGSSGSSPW